MNHDTNALQLEQIKQRINQLALDQGFQDAKVSDCNTDQYFEQFSQWVDENYHGQMSFLERNQELRKEPASLHPGTLRVISFRYNYLPENAQFAETLKAPNRANISRYALGRDYHKLLRKKLDSLAKILANEIEKDFTLQHRVFVDSAPVLESAFAEKSGLGWKGKHTLLINKDAGSWFFLGEIFINLALPVDPPVENLCGNCTACMSLCPTDAIIAPNKVDATRCISYLTIEHQGAIPTELRRLLGNRIYGCDDCQLACPWNRFSSQTKDADFMPRHKLDNISLLELWDWNEQAFLERFQGSPIRRIGYQNWLRNLAVAIGNSHAHPQTIARLKEKKADANAMVCEHIDWAIEQLEQRLNSQPDIINRKTSKLIHCVQTMLARDA